MDYTVAIILVALAAVGLFAHHLDRVDGRKRERYRRK